MSLTMKRIYLIGAVLLAVLLAGWGALWLEGWTGWVNSAQRGQEKVTTGATPGVDGYKRIAGQELTAKLEQVSRQLGPGFRVAIFEPFVVASNQSAGDFERVCKHTIRWAVEMLNKDFFSRRLDTIVTIYLFADEESYRKYAWSLFGEKPSTPYGYYSPGHHALVMNIGAGTGTLVHEIVHPLLAADFPRAPSWFDEGLASLYEQCRERNGQIVGLLNWRLPVLKEGLQAGHFVHFQKLLSTSSEEFYDDPQGMHYAQVRYLCYYLQERRLLRKFYQEFRKNHGSDPMGIKTLLKVTGKDSLQELEQEWLEFMEPLSYTR